MPPLIETAYFDLVGLLEDAIVPAARTVAIARPERFAMVFERTGTLSCRIADPRQLVALDFCPSVRPGCLAVVFAIIAVGNTVGVHSGDFQAHFAVTAVIPPANPDTRESRAVCRNACRGNRLACIASICRQLRLSKRSASENEERGDQSKNNFFEDLHGTLL